MCFRVVGWVPMRNISSALPPTIWDVDIGSQRKNKGEDILRKA
jgi:hypothetical protein